MTEAHHLVAQVADVINAMIIPVSSHWPWGDFPGRNNFLEADNLLSDLAQNCGDPVAIDATGEKSVARQLLCIDEQLEEALTQLLAAESHDVGQRYTLLLLASRAGEFIDELSEAYAGLPGSLADLRAMTTYEGLVARREPPPHMPSPPIRRVEGSGGPITRDTTTNEAGALGVRSVIACTYDIEAVAHAVILAGDDCDALHDSLQIGSMLRCYGARLKALNSILMGHFDADQITLKDVHQVMRSGADYLPEGALA
ncbi:hypothetical protein [Acidovorax sp.]|uniref:hypothetical protein n=1 Tax=Acidovorax sp. TaxID=1872122 RepID=UPI002ACD63B5|nr:hypothetical protein [Acidovorax sp.]MDZ7863353.1 hypothetical protein [Acidovorax sp.]